MRCQRITTKYYYYSYFAVVVTLTLEQHLHKPQNPLVCISIWFLAHSGPVRRYPINFCNSLPAPKNRFRFQEKTCIFIYYGKKAKQKRKHNIQIFKFVKPASQRGGGGEQVSSSHGIFSMYSSLLGIHSCVQLKSINCVRETKVLQAMQNDETEQHGACYLFSMCATPTQTTHSYPHSPPPPFPWGLVSFARHESKPN